MTSAIPYSASTSPNAPNVAVSTASTPASKYSRCIWATRSGRVSTRFSLHPSRSGPPKSSAVEVLALDPGPEGPVEDEDAGFEGSRGSRTSGTTGYCRTRAGPHPSPPETGPAATLARHDDGGSAPGARTRDRRSCPGAPESSAPGSSSPASRATASSPSPAARSARSATAGSPRSGRSASCSAPAPASRSSRRCRGRSPAAPRAGSAARPLVRRATIGDGGPRRASSSVVALVAGAVARRRPLRRRGPPARRAAPPARRLHARVPRAGRARRATRASAPYGILLGGEAGSRLLVAVGARRRRRRDRGSVRRRARARAVRRRARRAAQARRSRHPRAARAVARAHRARSAGCSRGRCSRRRSSTPGRSSCSCSGPRRTTTATGQFLASLVIARIPVFLFQGVQAALLPRLVRARRRGPGARPRVRDPPDDRWRSARSAWSRPPARGCSARRSCASRSAPTSRSDSRDLALLAAASCIYLLGLTLSQALIALRQQPRVAIGWGVGIVGAQRRHARRPRPAAPGRARLPRRRGRGVGRAWPSCSPARCARRASIRARADHSRNGGAAG